MKFEFILMVLGIISIEALLIGIVAYVGSRFILWYTKPEQGSNAHLRDWLNNGGTWQEFNNQFGS